MNGDLLEHHGTKCCKWKRRQQIQQIIDPVQSGRQSQCPDVVSSAKRPRTCRGTTSHRPRPSAIFVQGHGRRLKKGIPKFAKNQGLSLKTA